MTKNFFHLLSFGLFLQLLAQHACLFPEEAETRARMEEKAVSSISLKELEKMVEKMKPEVSPALFILESRFKNKAKPISSEDEKKLSWTDDSVAENFPYKQASSIGPLHYADTSDPILKTSGSDLDTEASSHFRFFEDLVSKTMRQHPEYMNDDLLTQLDFAASEYVPSYKPRFDYDSYVKDPLDVKLSGKPYWREPEPSHRREAVSDGRGCKTVVRKLRDEDGNEQTDKDGRVKSVIIAKECEYADGEGPDAKIAYTTREYQPSAPFQANIPRKPYENVRSDQKYYSSPESSSDSLSASSGEKTSARDPLKPGYIDDMLEKHFKSFSRMRNPLSLLRHHHDRFSSKLSKFDENKKKSEPVYKGYSYEYKYPETDKKEVSDSSAEEHTRDNDKRVSYQSYTPRQKTHPVRASSHPSSSEEEKEESPKTMKKSFAYYRKDNPKDDPDNHEYAEEYAQGNYRSFSTDYDSDRDGPSKNN